jgi:hypothetical protein
MLPIALNEVLPFSFQNLIALMGGSNRSFNGWWNVPHSQHQTRVKSGELLDVGKSPSVVAPLATAKALTCFVFIASINSILLPLHHLDRV